MQLLYWNKLNTKEKIQALARTQESDDLALTAAVKEIIAQVKADGDSALYAYAEKFDKVKLSDLVVSADEYQATESLDSKYKQAIIDAAANIRHYHEVSCPRGFEYQRDGARLGKMYRPIEHVGLYIPGGSAPLVSTLLMLSIPAQIAGCKTKILVTPPQKDGTIAPAILFAAKHCGIDTIYKVGGAQAIAALAYGTETIPKVHKIFGPGNKYVMEAKLQVATSNAKVALDMPAGPSEVLVIGDANANAAFIASDLLAQAEHDVAAQVIFVTTSKDLADKVLAEVELQQQLLSRKVVTAQSLGNSRVIIADSLDECFNISNQYAPEHLILHLDEADKYLDKVINAGSVFIGQWSPESVGDYASGTNHVLPTYGYANMYSGLDVIHFMKAISFQHLSEDGIKHIGKTVEYLAELEGLDAHKNAVTIRLNALAKSTQ